MLFLLIASAIWAFSFGIIKHTLAGVDFLFIAFVRLLVSFLIFAPFLRLRGISLSRCAQMIGIGAVQYGVMYAAYIYSYRFLAAHEVALFTVLTPLYVVLINHAAGRSFRGRAVLVSLLAVLGGGIVLWSEKGFSGTLTGFAVLQISNLSFAVGQVWYRKIMGASKTISGSRTDAGVFALLYLGGALVAGLAQLLAMGEVVSDVTGKQWFALLYLGAIPSGLGFFLWNAGARRVGAGALGAMNNVKIPLAVTVSLVFFNEQADLLKLVAGVAALLGAVIIATKHEDKP